MCSGLRLPWSESQFKDEWGTVDLRVHVICPIQSFLEAVSPPFNLTSVAVTRGAYSMLMTLFFRDNGTCGLRMINGVHYMRSICACMTFCGIGPASACISQRVVGVGVHGGRVQRPTLWDQSCWIGIRSSPRQTETNVTHRAFVQICVHPFFCAVRRARLAPLRVINKLPLLLRGKDVTVSGSFLCRWWFIDAVTPLPASQWFAHWFGSANDCICSCTSAEAIRSKTPKAEMET
ncbi:hypothetical protein H4582DRAFT_1058256 [Lactarius indigo]|nr:hypothetical protein H4582DRAFT_1058256 [Lactarius indigo]